MTPRVSNTWIASSSESEFESTAHTIIASLTGSLVFTNPAPTIPALTARLAAYTSAVTVARNGGKTETAAKNTARDLLEEDLRELGHYIDKTADTLEDFLSSNYPLQKERAPIGVQPAPANLRAKHGKVSGSLEAVCDVSDHRVMYEWQTATGQTPAEWTIQPSTNSSRASFSGFAPGTWVNTRCRIRVPAGPGDWSSVVQIMMV